MVYSTVQVHRQVLDDERLVLSKIARRRRGRGESEGVELVRKLSQLFSYIRPSEVCDVNGAQVL